MDEYLQIGLAWCAAFLGLLGGFGFCIWAYNAHHIDPQVLCIQQHGTWTYSSVNENYTCQFGGSK